MKVYILVRLTEDSEGYEVHVFRSVHASLEKAEKAKKEMIKDFGEDFGDLRIWERKLE